jgi:hypothetical protein
MDRRSEGQLSRRPETVATREKKKTLNFFFLSYHLGQPNFSKEAVCLSVCLYMYARPRPRVAVAIAIAAPALGRRVSSVKISPGEVKDRLLAFSAWQGALCPTRTPLHRHHRNPICFSSRSRVFWLSGETPSVGSDSEGVRCGRASGRARTFPEHRGNPGRIIYI